MSAIEERLRGIVAANLDVEPERVTRDANIIDDLGADSLDTVELLMAAEEAFAVEIPDEQWEQASTFGQMADLIRSRL